MKEQAKPTKLNLDGLLVMTSLSGPFSSPRSTASSQFVHGSIVDSVAQRIAKSGVYWTEANIRYYCDHSRDDANSIYRQILDNKKYEAKEKPATRRGGKSLTVNKSWRINGPDSTNINDG